MWLRKRGCTGEASDHVAGAVSRTTKEGQLAAPRYEFAVTVRSVLDGSALRVADTLPPLMV